MKQLFFIFLSLLLIFSCKTKETIITDSTASSNSKHKVDFIEKPIELQKVLSMAKKENKIVFVDVYADWCGPCKAMDKEVFSKHDVATFYNTNFINFKMDADNTIYLLDKINYEITGLPSFLFLDADGKVIKKVTGYTTDSYLLGIAKNIVSDHKNDM